MKKTAGFTLFETIVVIILIGILAGASLQGLVLGTRNYIVATRDYLELFREGKTAMERMVREIRHCKPVNVTFPAGGINIVKELDTPEDPLLSVLFFQDGSRIKRQSGGVGYTLVEYVKTGSFSSSTDANGVVTLGFTLKRGNTEIQLQTCVFPRI